MRLPCLMQFTNKCRIYGSLRDQLHLKEFEVISALDRTDDDDWFEESEISGRGCFDDECEIRPKDCGGMLCLVGISYCSVIP
jgi:hypothetical protein